MHSKNSPWGGEAAVLAAARARDLLIVACFLCIYFLSGFSALLYQVIWQRMLAIFSGSDLYATTMIVAAFMAGLGIGSLVGGRLADALSFRWQIGLFALLELAVGAFALTSSWLYYDVLYVRHMALASSPFVLALVLFCSLLVPTACMGMSFPLISKALTPDIALAGRRIGSLYALNTLGAALGAFVTIWFWLGRLDFSAILAMGARINFLVAVIAPLAGLAAWVKHKGSATHRADSRGETAVEKKSVLSFSTWMWLYALAGFLALSWEIVWFRLLGVMLKSNSFTFPHLLALYLGCLAVGIMAGARLVHLGNQPGRVYLALQAAVTLYAGFALVALFWLLGRGRVGWLNSYFAGFDPLDVSVVGLALDNWRANPGGVLSALTATEPGFLHLYLLLPLFLMGPPTALMGASFAFLQRTVQDDVAQLGRRVGWLQGANILGATLGAIVTGTLLLHLLGTAWTARLLIAVGAGFLVLWIVLSVRMTLQRRAALAAAMLVTCALMGSIPPGPKFWAQLHGAPAELVIAAENGTGVSVLRNDRADFSGTTIVYVNGLGQSWIPFNAIALIHSQLGILPLMLHPAPVEVAVIGLGSGDTAYSLGGRKETARITVIEIVQPQLATLQQLQTRRPYNGLQGLLQDTRFEFVFTDGRTFLGRQTRMYDVIEADALRPTSAFAGNLYSYEYFLLLKSRLKPGGLAVTWAPTGRVIDTFVQAFPHVLQIGAILVGSTDPIEYEPELIRARAQDPFTRAHYVNAGIDVMAAVAPLLAAEVFRYSGGTGGDRDINRDLHPKDEYGR